MKNYFKSMRREGVGDLKSSHSVDSSSLDNCWPQIFALINVDFCLALLNLKPLPDKLRNVIFCLRVLVLKLSLARHLIHYLYQIYLMINCF